MFERFLECFETCTEINNYYSIPINVGYALFVAVEANNDDGTDFFIELNKRDNDTLEPCAPYNVTCVTGDFGLFMHTISDYLYATDYIWRT